MLVLLFLVNTASCLGSDTHEGPVSDMDASENVDNHFVDISEDDWFYDAVLYCTDRALIVDSSITQFKTTDEMSNQFEPFQEVLTSTAIAHLAHFHNIWSETPLIEEIGLKFWSMPYRWYAEDHGLLASYHEEESVQSITRSSFVSILYHSVPPEIFSGTGDDITIPDVDKNTELGEIIYKFYGANILCGTNESHSFEGDRPITRVEMAMIFYRIMQKINPSG